MRRIQRDQLVRQPGLVRTVPSRFGGDVAECLLHRMVLQMLSATGRLLSPTVLLGYTYTPVKED